jgi:hypothetical protein
MDLHIRDGLLSRCLILVGCCMTFFHRALEIFRQLVDNGHSTCWPHGGGCLLGEHPSLEKEHLAFRRRALSLRQHGVAWMLAWRHGVDLGMPDLRQCSCKGTGPNGARDTITSTHHEFHNHQIISFFVSCSHSLFSSLRQSLACL